MHAGTSVPPGGRSPRERQVLADVVGVAVVEVGGERPLRALGRPAEHLPGCPAAGAEQTAADAGDGPHRRARALRGGRQSSVEAPAAAVGAWWEPPLRFARSPSVVGSAIDGDHQGSRARESTLRGAEATIVAEGDSLADQAVGLLGELDLRDMAAVVEHHLLGARQGGVHVAGEAGRDDPVASPPDEQGGGVELGQPGVEARPRRGLVEVDVPRGGEERDPRRHASGSAAELIDGDSAAAGSRRSGARTGSPGTSGRGPPR